MNTSEPSKSLVEIQQEIGTWANMNFGHNVSKDPLSVSYGHPLGSLPSLLGVMEELGELARVVARRHQGRGYKDAVEAQDAKEDAVADLLVFLCDFCHREGINLQPVLNRVWAKVKQRKQATWAEDKAKERVGTVIAGTEEMSPGESAALARLRAIPAGELGCMRGPPQPPLRTKELPDEFQVPPTETVFQDGHGFGHRDEGETNKGG